MNYTLKISTNDVTLRIEEVKSFPDDGSGYHMTEDEHLIEPSLTTEAMMTDPTMEIVIKTWLIPNTSMSLSQVTAEPKESAPQ